MKKIKIFAVALAFMASFTACDKEYDSLTKSETEGGLITIEETSFGMKPNTSPTSKFSTAISTFQGSVRTTSIDVYKQFQNSTGKSQKVFLKNITFPVTAQRETINFEFSYNELISGLTVNNAPLPVNPFDVEAGAFWNLTFVSKTSTGKVHQHRETVKVTMQTRYAGKYKVISNTYYRIGVINPATIVGTIINVESLNATDYRLVDNFGVFVSSTTFPELELFFKIDNSLNITYPALKPNGSPQGGVSATAATRPPLTTCATTPQHLTNIGCANTNKVENDNTNFKDKLHMTYGYLITGTAADGPREFYMVLEKVN